MLEKGNSAVVGQLRLKLGLLGGDLLRHLDTLSVQQRQTRHH